MVKGRLQLKIDNPFESGQIKNYILLYVAIIVIMVLFFVATTLFNKKKNIEKRVFDVNVSEVPHANKVVQKTKEANSFKFRLLEKVKN